MKLTNEICVVTGGLSGLGLATSERLIALGARVAILDFQEASHREKKWGSQARILKVDVSNPDEVKVAVSEVLRWSEELKVNIAAVICCAGILGPAKVVSKDGKAIPLDAFEKVVKINLFGTIDVIRQLIPTMATQEPDSDGEKGVVITVASAAAFDGQPGQRAYSGPGRPDEFAAMVEHIIANSMLNGSVLRLDGATRMLGHL